MMFFTVIGFISQGGRYLDFNQGIYADSPHDAMEIMLKQYANLVVSGVCRVGRA